MLAAAPVAGVQVPVAADMRAVGLPPALIPFPLHARSHQFGLVAGAKLFVEGAIDGARLLGMSEAVIGLTIVAAGTSLPEVATSVVATIKGQRDIAIGNVVGSNMFNIFAIVFTSAVFFV